MFVLFIGLGNACAVMVGNKIGAGGKDVAFEYGRRFAILGVAVALLAGVIVFSMRGTVISLYQISPSAAQNLRSLMLVYSLSAWLESSTLCYLSARCGQAAIRALPCSRNCFPSG